MQQRKSAGEKSSGRVDYAIKALDVSPKDVILILYAQNLTQLENCIPTNRTADQAFENDYFDYLYGIVSTGTEWHFIMYTPDGIYSTSGNEYQINLTKSAIKEG